MSFVLHIWHAGSPDTVYVILMEKTFLAIDACYKALFTFWITRLKHQRWTEHLNPV